MHRPPTIDGTPLLHPPMFTVGGQIPAWVPGPLSPCWSFPVPGPPEHPVNDARRTAVKRRPAGRTLDMDISFRHEPVPVPLKTRPPSLRAPPVQSQCLRYLSKIPAKPCCLILL